MPLDTETAVRHDWTMGEAEALYHRPFNDLLFDAQTLHRRYFDANQVQLSRLISIKSGGCPEDCAYCPQSAGYDTDVTAEKLMEVDKVVAAARQARDDGATRYCMGAAWRNPKDSDLENVCAMVEEVRALGLETCATLGMLSEPQAMKLKLAGLDYYNHNLDTSEEFYGDIITTRTYQDRLDTLENVRRAGINVCCGGIVGLGESRQDRAGLLVKLANLNPHPESVPINMLVRVEGTPLETVPDLDGIEFVRTLATAKIMMPASVIRLSAGRQEMTDEMQALCFLAGAGSIFVGDKLLTTANPDGDTDNKLFDRLGLRPAPAEGKPA
ncbi:MAG TPA: biotin synthase BioB [Rhodospirillales bacterium]|jgi:biotin synthase|nr:MAG: Biotin synthase [Alphaproteobacteria bacterium MarineAlpha3_Bin1]PPR70871.1 MAG: Biotin synthase [Alphaproteobacteria bacterium MarineAlpha3_Bin2]HIM77149.1 biotin synthase BioB [Rhodospirillales bacterium]